MICSASLSLPQMKLLSGLTQMILASLNFLQTFLQPDNFCFCYITDIFLVAYFTCSQWLDYVACNVRMNWKGSGKKRCWLNRREIPEFSWRNWGKSLKTSAWIIDVAVEMRADDPSNRSQEQRFRYSNPFDISTCHLVPRGMKTAYPWRKWVNSE